MTLTQMIQSIITDELNSGNVVTVEEVTPYATDLYNQIQTMLLTQPQQK